MRVLPIVLALAWQAAAQSFAPLPTVDLGRYRPSDFSDQDLELPFYLAHFGEFAGAVNPGGPHRGFIALSVWRNQKDNQPYNARVMENILSLAFFYTLDRPWNPYRGSPAVRQRLEAALDFWCRIQSPDGRFSEYGPEKWNLAATAFATKFMGQTLELLKNGPPVDEATLRRTVAADRKAIHVVLTDAELYRVGKSYSNQYSNVFAGALAYLKLYPDPELARLLRVRIEQSSTDLQSPAGFFYEADGPDWGYNLSTHHSNLHMAWHYTRGTELGKILADQEQRWFTWLAWNAVPEPGYGGWYLNRAIETRQRHGFLASKDTALGEAAPAARAFSTTPEEERARLAAVRERLVKNWPRVDPLRKGEFWSWSPYAFLHRDHGEWRPTAAVRDAARRMLPYRVRDRFIHTLRDTRHPWQVTCVRRPAYYAVFNSGKVLRDQQRYGLGLLWSPRTGALLQSQSRGETTAWGTRAEGAARVYEASHIEASLELAVMRYKLGAKGEKMLRFDDGAIVVTVRHPGSFTEYLPLLATEAPRITAGEVRSADLTVRISPSTRVRILAAEGVGGPKRLYPLQLEAEGDLEYRLLVGQ